MAEIDVKDTLFKALDSEREAILLAQHLPKGLAWSNGFNQDTNLGKLVAGLAVEYYRLSVLTYKVSTELDIRETDELISEWERSVGIPNECFLNTVSLEERRRNVELVLSNFGGVQTKDDLVRVGSIFGFSITVHDGMTPGSFPLPFPFMFFTEVGAKFTIVINPGVAVADSFFPLPFPLPFSTGGTSFLQCIFDKLVQANVVILFTTDIY